MDETSREMTATEELAAHMYRVFGSAEELDGCMSEKSFTFFGGDKPSRKTLVEPENFFHDMITKLEKIQEIIIITHNFIKRL